MASVRVTSQMGITENKRKMSRRVLDALNLQWISNTGRFVLRCLSFGNIKFPEADMSSYKFELENAKGFGSRLWLAVRYFVVDSIYFPIGLVFWASMFFLAVYMLRTKKKGRVYFLRSHFRGRQRCQEPMALP